MEKIYKLVAVNNNYPDDLGNPNQVFASYESNS